VQIDRGSTRVWATFMAGAGSSGAAGRGWPGVACVRCRRSVRVGWSGRRRKSVLVRQENMRLGKSMVLFGSAAVGQSQSQSQSSDSVIIIKISH
jgi:hypothetical protein